MGWAEQEIRKCLTARTYAGFSDHTEALLRTRSPSLSQDERASKVSQLSLKLMRKFLGRNYADRYLSPEGASNSRLEDAELLHVRKVCRLIDIHTTDPLIGAIHKIVPEFSYRNGSKRKMFCPIPSRDTVKIGWYCISLKGTFPTMRVFSTSELSFVGEGTKEEEGKLFEVYWGMPWQVFFKYRGGGAPLAGTWTFSQGVKRHAQEMRERYMEFYQ